MEKVKEDKRMRRKGRIREREMEGGKKKERLRIRFRKLCRRATNY